ncbi:MAG: sulfotransferase [Pseudomonadota bacterium]
MRYPNLLLAGVQKAGTTWLHETLSGSRHIFGSTPKELKLWGHPGWRDRLAQYRAHFPTDAKPGARFFMESTPHYFHAPTVLGDIAQDIRDTVPDIRVMVILRNPVERYRSAYTHHMQKGRFPFVAEIDDVTDAQIMLSTGLYGTILSHWRTVFPDMLVLSHDRLERDPGAFLNTVFAGLGLDCDIDLMQLPAPKHTAEEKRASAAWPVTPQLSTCAKAALARFYRDDMALLATLVDFDPMAWLEDVQTPP